MIDAAAAGECAMIAKCVLVKTVHLSYLTPKEEEVQITRASPHLIFVAIL